MKSRVEVLRIEGKMITVIKKEMRNLDILSKVLSVAIIY